MMKIRCLSNTNISPVKLMQHKAQALGIAADNGHYDIVNVLLTYNAPVNAVSLVSKSVLCMQTCYYKQSQQSALFNASSRGYIEIVRVLLDAGADVKAVSKVIDIHCQECKVLSEKVDCTYCSR